MKNISGIKTDEERAFYNLHDAVLTDCIFAGENDGESALKETENIEIYNCRFSLRYPLWHTKNYVVSSSVMDENTRAALWYAKNGEIKDSLLGGIKCLRECENTRLENCEIISPEFCWKCKNTSLFNCKAKSEYPFFESEDIVLHDSRLEGKYSFQYAENVKIKNAYLDTKDAFWHSKNVTVENSVIKGEYLGWYSENLLLINCRIIGTQPLCYCKGLRMLDCTMEETDLSFEYSEVEAEIIGSVLSVKNPKSGHIHAYSIGEIINENAVIECNCVIKTDK